MALTKAAVEMWASLKGGGAIVDCPRVLEIGQANWYGDAPSLWVGDPFQVARSFYAEALNYSAITAIDLHAPPGALPLDLNEPLDFHGSTFDIVINSGTTEHIFDQRQVFQTIHEACCVGGLMVHSVPVRGWLDHGLYSYQPTFFYDLAYANRYEQVYWREVDVAGDVELYVVFRKLQDTPFEVPMQGRYR